MADNNQLLRSTLYTGVVKHRDDTTVMVLFEIDDELIEHTYDEDQFVDGKLPNVGDDIIVHTHLVVIPKVKDGNAQLQPTDGLTTKQVRDHDTGPLAV